MNIASKSGLLGQQPCCWMATWWFARYNRTIQESVGEYGRLGIIRNNLIAAIGLPCWIISGIYPRANLPQLRRKPGFFFFRIEALFLKWRATLTLFVGKLISKLMSVQPTTFGNNMQFDFHGIFWTNWNQQALMGLKNWLLPFQQLSTVLTFTGKMSRQ